ncbi:hypothetical protein I553_4118 [Mycobacterium xenopi 4042]|uniref:Uncharacterized protein n=1 Tax=Mycobacterium xenopi 4042 TaxID=1299334 RepID=X8AG98_MYCXE|nr:hypothetical protein I553_4118 [Mycobacterium xenopi 4042]
MDHIAIRGRCVRRPARPGSPFDSALGLRTDVDEHGAAAHRAGHLLGGKPAQSGPGATQHPIYPAGHGTRSVNSVRRRRSVLRSVTS